jgi:hypothetical protein
VVQICQLLGGAGRFVLGDARRNKHESPKAEAGGKKTSMEWLHGVLQVDFTERIN